MTTPLTRRTATRLRAIIGAQKIDLTAMARQLGHTRAYLTHRVHGITPTSTEDIQQFADFLGYTTDELLADRFILHDDD